MPNKYGPLDHDVVWASYAQGQLPAEIGRSMGRPPDAIYGLIYKAGGIKRRLDRSGGHGRGLSCLGGAHVVATARSICSMIRSSTWTR